MRAEDQRLINEVEKATKKFMVEKFNSYTQLDEQRIKLAMFIGVRLGIASDQRDIESYLSSL